MKKESIEILKRGGIGVAPTDTLYGLVGRAFSREAVERIYKAKIRTPDKALIVLVSSVEDLKKFGVEISRAKRDFLEKFWPGKVSVILPFKKPGLGYLDRAGGTLAFRLPDKKDLLDAIKETGPLVAPSADPEGNAAGNKYSGGGKIFREYG